MISALFELIVKFFSWLFVVRKELPTEVRLSYEGLALMYDRLLKTINHRLERTDDKLQKVTNLFDECYEERLQHREAIVLLKERIHEIEVELKSIRKLSDIDNK